MKNEVLADIAQEKMRNIRESLEKAQSNILEVQNNFLKTNLGQAINSGIDIGLKVVLPDVVEDEIISVKDALITEGFSAAIDTAIDEAINLGKSAMGILTGTFENISQINKAVEKGGLIDYVSEILNAGIKWISKKGYIKKTTATALKKGKDTVLKIIDKNVENELEKEIEAVDKLNGYIEKWQKYYEEQNFTNMEYQYKKIEENLEKVMPIEETLIKARQIENLHELIKNKGKDFNLSNEEKELANMLIK